MQQKISTWWRSLIRDRSPVSVVVPQGRAAFWRFSECRWGWKRDKYRRLVASWPPAGKTVTAEKGTREALAGDGRCTVTYDVGAACLSKRVNTT
jgi:hypothetical protein